MKKIKFYLLKLLKPLIEKLIKIYSKLRMDTITILLEKCLNANGQNTITYIKEDSTLTKLIYFVELQNCHFNVEIERKNNVVSVLINGNHHTSTDKVAWGEEFYEYTKKLAPYEEPIKKLFLNL